MNDSDKIDFLMGELLAMQALCQTLIRTHHNGAALQTMLSEEMSLARQGLEKACATTAAEKGFDTIAEKNAAAVTAKRERQGISRKDLHIPPFGDSSSSDS